MIAIIDYGVGNLRSVEKGLEYVGVDAMVTKEPSEIERSDAIVLPGVGAFESGMEKIEPLKSVILERVKEGTPLLGICLGMQMLFEESDEGGIHKGLGLVKGRVSKFTGVPKVPHMGWNSLSITKPHPIVLDIPENSFVYFVHSYRAEVCEHTIAATEYSGKFTAVVANDNVVGTQFHPEKSGDLGLRMLKNFAKMIV